MAANAADDAGAPAMVPVAEARAYMKEKVDPVMSELLTALVTERPDDVLAFVIAHCQARREHTPEMQQKRQEVARQFGQQAERPVTPPGKYSRKDYGGRHVSYSGTLGGGSGATGGTTLGGGAKDAAGKEDGEAAAAPRVLSAAERREAMLQAAERRSQSKNGKRGAVISEAKKKELAQKRKRDEMVGRIRAMYAASGVDEPFGLGMAKMEVLQMHYDRAKGFARGHTKLQEREGAARGALKL